MAKMANISFVERTKPFITGQDDSIASKSKLCEHITQQVEAEKCTTVGARLGNFYRGRDGDVLSIDTACHEFSNPWLFHSFFNGAKLDIIKWFQAKKLLRTEMTCTKCGRPCILCKRERSLDGYSFRCDSGQHECSVRYGSFFNNFRFALGDVIMFLMNLLDGMTLKQNALKINLNYNQAAPRWAKLVRLVMAERVWAEYFTSDGTAYKLGDLVECDESKFGRKVKANSGCPRGRCVWLMGIVEKHSGRLLLLPIQNR